MTLHCRNCFEESTYEGPTGRGNSTTTFLKTPDDVGIVFCSEACAEWWFTVVGHRYFDRDSLQIAVVGGSA